MIKEGGGAVPDGIHKAYKGAYADIFLREGSCPGATRVFPGSPGSPAAQVPGSTCPWQTSNRNGCERRCRPASPTARAASSLRVFGCACSSFDAGPTSTIRPPESNTAQDGRMRFGLSPVTTVAFVMSISSSHTWLGLASGIPKHRSPRGPGKPPHGARSLRRTWPRRAP